MNWARHVFNWIEHNRWSFPHTDFASFCSAKVTKSIRSTRDIQIRLRVDKSLNSCMKDQLHGKICYWIAMVAFHRQRALNLIPRSELSATSVIDMNGGLWGENFIKTSRNFCRDIIRKVFNNSANKFLLTWQHFLPVWHQTASVARIRWVLWKWHIRYHLSNFSILLSSKSLECCWTSEHNKIQEEDPNSATTRA